LAWSVGDAWTLPWIWRPWSPLLLEPCQCGAVKAIPPHVGQGAGQGIGSPVLNTSPQPSQHHSVLRIRSRTTRSGARPSSLVRTAFSSARVVFATTNLRSGNLPSCPCCPWSPLPSTAASVPGRSRCWKGSSDRGT